MSMLHVEEMKSQRTPAAKITDLRGELPATTVPKDYDQQLLEQEAITLLNNLSLDNLAQNAIWRDFMSMTGTYRTFYSADKVSSTFTALSNTKRRSLCRPTSRAPRFAAASPNSSWFDVDFEFTTQEGKLQGHCNGTVSVCVGENEQWRIWMIRTWLEHFEGYQNPDILQPAFNANGEIAGILNESSTVYDALIAGGGQCGLALAGRLQALGLNYVLFEKDTAVGDVWRQRYDSLAWHTIKEYGELPFGRTFDEKDPVLVPRGRIGDGFQAWATKYGIRACTGSSVESATWDAGTRAWTVRVATVRGERTFLTKNFILCIGGGGSIPVYPAWAESHKVQESGFKGTVVHSKDYRNCAKWAGLRGVVVGTANTGHDIAEDMLRAGMHTTMLQRSPTFVFPAEWLHHAQAVDYNRVKSTEQADRESVTHPLAITRQMINTGLHGAIKAHPERFDALEKAGFLLDRYGDICNNLFSRFGGHYLDTGASAKISNGDIAIKTGQVRQLVQNGLIFEDGSRLETDVVVVCTGFDHDYRRAAKSILGDAADTMDEYWGFDDEGEMRGVSKPAGHPGLYYHGGDIRFARWFARFIALRIQAEKLGSAVPLYQEL